MQRIRMPGNGRFQDWARLAMKCGLLLTDAKLWSSLNDQFRDRMDDVNDSVSHTYADATTRLQNATDALRRRGSSRLAYFCLGMGVGTGVALLFAPASGQETRDVIRDRAGNVKKKVSDAAATATTRFRQSTGAQATGTQGD